MKTSITARERQQHRARWIKQRVKYWVAYFKSHGEDCQFKALAWAIPVVGEEITKMHQVMAQ